MQKRDFIIHYLANSKSEYVTSFQLSNLLKNSTRTVLRYIREIQSKSHKHGFEIISNKGQGYRLKIIDQPAFQQYLAGKVLEQGKSDFDKLEYNVARQLLLSNSSIKLDDLAIQYNYSRSSMSRITSEVSSIFEEYNLDLESKPHQGLSVQGSEINFRHCISNLFFEGYKTEQSAKMLDVDHMDWAAIKEELAEMATSRQLYCKPDSISQFIKYCFIIVNRMSNEHYINFEHVYNIEYDVVSSETLSLMSGLLLLFFPEFKETSDNQWEKFYLALAWEQNFYPLKKFYDYNSDRIKYTMKIVNKAIENIKNYYGVDFSKDPQFAEELAEHISACYGKYLLNIESDTPRLDEVRSKYPTAYYYSVEVAACINEHTRTKIPDDELSLITLHFAASIEREFQSKQIKAIIFCKTEFGTAALLKSRIKKQYENINIIDTCTFYEAKYRQSNADFYISTIPTEEKNLNGKPVLQLSPFLNEQDCHLLDTLIAKLTNADFMQNICQPNDFYIINKPTKKAHLLNYLCDCLLQEGRITEKEKADIFARESLVSTEIAPYVAMPHCIIHGSSFLVFAILPKSVMWGQSRINLIVLGCFHEGDDQIKNVLKQLYKVISNKDQVNKIIGCKSYEEFIKIFSNFIGEEL